MIVASWSFSIHQGIFKLRMYSLEDTCRFDCIETCVLYGMKKVADGQALQHKSLADLAEHLDRSLPVTECSRCVSFDYTREHPMKQSL